MAKSVICKANSVSEAVDQALEILEAEREQVEVKVLAEPRKRLFRRNLPAEVEVSLLEPVAGKIDKPKELKRIDGKLWIENGELKYKAPEEGGRPPVLAFNDTVKVTYNGTPMNFRVELTQGFDGLVVSLPPDQEPKRFARIDVTPDKLIANLITHVSPGVTYRLKETNPSSLLHLDIEQREIPVDNITRAEIEKLIEEENITYGLKIVEVMDQVLEKKSCNVVLAEGKPAVPPKSGRINYLFKEKDINVDLEADIIDYFELHSVPNVNKGDLLATKIPSTPGEDGIDVFGNILKAPSPKEIRLNIGEGVFLDDDESNAYASKSGQPTLHNGLLKVIQTYEVKGDADVNTGNIRFNGEVIIRGNVRENVKIKASDGGVQVHGMVDRAIIDADQDIIIVRNAIGSQISAGGANILHIRLSTFLVELNDQLTKLRQAFKLVHDQNKDSEHGVLIKNLLELKFSKIPELISNFENEFADILKSLEKDLRNLMITLKTFFVGRGPLSINDVSELDLAIEQLAYWMAIYQTSSEETADITVSYLQNSKVEASGIVRITGQGVYNSQIIAGKGFEQNRGVFRGGTISIKEGDVKVRELGGPTGILTKVEISGRGEITVGTIFPNVEISINKLRYNFLDDAKNIRAYVSSEGQLVVFSGTKKLT